MVKFRFKAVKKKKRVRLLEKRTRNMHVDSRLVSAKFRVEKKKKFIHNKSRVSRMKKINFRKSMVKCGWLLLIGLTIWSLVWMFGQLKVKKFECRSQYGDCSVEINSWLDSYSLRFPLSVWNDLVDELQYRFPQVSNASLSWVNLRTVRLSLVVDDPVVTVTTTRLMRENRYFEVSSNGVVVDEITGLNNLPVLILNQLNNGVGESLPDVQKQVVRIVRQMMFRGYQFEEVEQVKENVLKIKLYSGESILFSLDRKIDAEQLVSALQLILSQATIEGDKLQVDMRFKQPVLRDLSVTVVLTPEATESGNINDTR